MKMLLPAIAIHLLVCGIAEGKELEEVKNTWREEIRAKASPYLERRTKLAGSYARICREEEAAAKKSGHRLAQIFWESEREGVLDGDAPPADIKYVPGKAAEIRSKWQGALGKMDREYENLVTGKVRELDEALEQLELITGADENREKELREVLWTRMTLNNSPDYAMLIARGKDEEHGYIVPGDVALATYGAEEFVQERKGGAIDGIKDRGRNLSRFTWPGAMDISLQTTFRLDRVRFQLYHFLWSDKERYFRYRLRVSLDGTTWETVVDRREEGEWRGWQDIKFSPRPVKWIRLEGTYNSKSEWWTITEVEAYCPTTRN